MPSRITRSRAAILALAAGASLLAVLGAGMASAAPRTAGQDGRSGGRDRAVVVEDVQIEVPGQEPVAAWLVHPRRAARPHSLAATLYLHWFEPGNPTQSRDEYLAEAVQLAGNGMVALLPQLSFPWAGDPVGDERDRAAIERQLVAVQRAYDALLAQRSVDAGRTAVVGHDYGGMYGAILAQRDRRVHTAVLMAVDATWANWFDRFWLGLPEDQQAAYRAVFAGLDPVDNVSRLADRLFLQWAGNDFFIPAEVRDEFTAAAPQARSTVYERAEHFLTQPARDDRAAWLTDQLDLS